MYRCIDLDAYFLTRKDVDTRVYKSSKKPLLHFHTQFKQGNSWETMDMDFMNLNQSAHGDREFGHVTRMRKIVK